MNTCANCKNWERKIVEISMNRKVPTPTGKCSYLSNELIQAKRVFKNETIYFDSTEGFETNESFGCNGFVKLEK